MKPVTTATRRLAIIDGKSVFYRGYYAMPNLATREGTPTGGVYGFTAMALELLKKLQPDYVVVAWDKPKTNIRKRKVIHPEYKAGRKPAPPDFYEQIPVLHELLEAFHWPLYELDDYEADDIMGALARQAVEDHGMDVCLITSDLDALQLLGPKTHLYALKKGFTQIDFFRPEEFEAKYGIGVHQFLDLKALKGDSSDNIPGVPGVGEKTAIQLLQQYESLDGIYEHIDEIKETLRKKLIAGKKSAYMSKEVAELWLDAPVKLNLEAADSDGIDTAKLKGLMEKLEFRSLLRNLPEHMQHIEAEPDGNAVVIEPAALGKLDEPAAVSLTMAEKIIVYKKNDDWLLSSEEGKAFRTDIQQAVNVLDKANIVAHDSTKLIKDMLDAGLAFKNLPIIAHDTRQGGFMINSLVKSRTLDDMVSINLSDDDNGSLAISALWQVYKDQLEDFSRLTKVAELARVADFPLIPLLARMEQRGIKLDCEYLKQMSQELGERLNLLESSIHGHAGYEFNIGSPSQLADVLYGKLQLSTIGIKKGKTGYSTGASELDKLRGAHPIVELITKWRELSKLKSTYVDSLPKLVDENSRLHTTFNQDVAATGRLSSTDPNLQNIPIRTEEGKKIRTAFIPENGNVFVSADYSQFELRLAAVLAGDKQMIKDFESDIDIHAKTASDVLGIPLDKVTKEQRRDAKVINFGVLYGMSPHGLAAATGMTFGDAKKFIDEYFKLRAPVRRFIDQTLEKARSEGYVETLLGRRRPTPDVRSSNFVVRQAAQRAAANMPIQGTEADLMKLAMLEVDKKLDNLGEQLLQIHDSILVECPKENAGKVGEILKSTMENIYPDLGINLKVDVSTGRHWGEL